jgi:hypothetical protein
MNSVVSILNRWGPLVRNCQFENSILVKVKPYLEILILINRYVGMYKHAEWLCGCDMSNSLFCFVCLLMGSSDLDPVRVQIGAA